jgi:hypothetical protein
MWQYVRPSHVIVTVILFTNLIWLKKFLRLCLHCTCILTSLILASNNDKANCQTYLKLFSVYYSIKILRYSPYRISMEMLSHRATRHGAPTNHIPGSFLRIRRRGQPPPTSSPSLAKHPHHNTYRWQVGQARRYGSPVSGSFSLSTA